MSEGSIDTLVVGALFETICERLSSLCSTLNGTQLNISGLNANVSVNGVVNAAHNSAYCIEIGNNYWVISYGKVEDSDGLEYSPEIAHQIIAVPYNPNRFKIFGYTLQKSNSTILTEVTRELEHASNQKYSLLSGSSEGDVRVYGESRFRHRIHAVLNRHHTSRVSECNLRGKWYCTINPDSSIGMEKRYNPNTAEILALAIKDTLSMRLSASTGRIRI